MPENQSKNIESKTRKWGNRISSPNKRRPRFGGGQPDSKTNHVLFNCCVYYQVLIVYYVVLIVYYQVLTVYYLVLIV